MNNILSICQEYLAVDYHLIRYRCLDCYDTKIVWKDETEDIYCNRDKNHHIEKRIIDTIEAKNRVLTPTGFGTFEIKLINHIKDLLDKDI
jgi:hypothetical protein